jgi:RNA polymerase sporulation-specific sigma factor
MGLLDYPAFSDLELHAMYLSGDADAGNELVLRYRRLVKICIRPYFLAGGDSEDLLQEGMIGLLSAIREYDPDGGSSFRSFAELCIRRRVISAARSASRRKHAPLNDGLSLEQLQSGDSQLSFEHVLAPSAEELVLDRTWTDDFIAANSRFLSEFEADILMDYLSGASYGEMAQRAGRSEKSIDNAIQRIRKKLARHVAFPGDLS